VDVAPRTADVGEVCDGESYAFAWTLAFTRCACECGCVVGVEMGVEDETVRLDIGLLRFAFGLEVANGCDAEGMVYERAGPVGVAGNGGKGGGPEAIPSVLPGLIQMRLLRTRWAGRRTRRRR